MRRDRSNKQFEAAQVSGGVSGRMSITRWLTWFRRLEAMLIRYR